MAARVKRDNQGMAKEARLPFAGVMCAIFGGITLLPAISNMAAGDIGSSAYRSGQQALVVALTLLGIAALIGIYLKCKPSKPDASAGHSDTGSVVLGGETGMGSAHSADLAGRAKTATPAPPIATPAPSHSNPRRGGGPEPT